SMKTRGDFVTLALLLAGMINGFSEPTITKQPTNQSVSLGANVRFQVSATSSAPPVSYQWRFMATPLAAQTHGRLSLTNVQLIHAGDYDAVATDSSGSMTSRVAHLEIDPAFTKITTGRIVNDGGTSIGCAWGDYDDDGFIDLFVSNCDCPDGGGFLYHNN